MRVSSTVAERPHILIKRRKGRSIAVPRGKRRAWRIVAECLAMMALSWAIMALGALAGFYSRQRVFDTQGQHFAEDSMKTALSQPSIVAATERLTPALVADRTGDPSTYLRYIRMLDRGRAVEGCFGRSRLELFNPAGFVFASYVCEIDAREGLIAANVGLRRDPGAWKVVSLYVSAPETSRP